MKIIPLLQLILLLLVKTALSSLIVSNGTLLITSTITSHNSLSDIDDNGYIKAMYKYKTFSIDIGFNRGQTSTKWLTDLPNLFVIGIEANDLLVSHFKYLPHFDQYRDREILINGAVSTKKGIAKFNPGIGWGNVSDTGSLFGWSDPKREVERKRFKRGELTVELIRIDDILKHVLPPNPPNFYWDTFKVDIQGSDVEAIISAGDFIKNFVCVVGEFDYNAYDLPKDIMTDPKMILTGYNFKKVYGGVNEIWMNSLYIEAYRSNPELFGCHLVYDSITTPDVLLKGYDSA